jgi:hypothetical protein
MNWKSPSVPFAILFAMLGPLACGEGPASDLGSDLTVEALACRTAPEPEAIKVGVLVDDTSPAKANFIAAARLAESQINAGLSQARDLHRLEVVVSSYAAGQAQAAAIDLVNNQGVLGVVGDVSGNTAAVNRLNYENPPRIAHKIPVTCYQCSSAFFNDPSQTDLGFADPENWLFRTFFNAQFESAVQVQLVLNRPGGGETNGDGHLKIVVYYDSFHLSAATTMAPLLDSLHPGPHSVELVAKGSPLGEAPTAEELDEIFDDNVGPPESPPDGFPDAVYLALLPQNGPVSLAAYTQHPASPKPPATANNGLRRDFLLPALLAAGGEGFEGSSVLQVAHSRAGSLFRSAFVAATGQQPELTASFLYDAIAAQTLATLWAASFGSTSPEVIQGNFPNVNTPGGTAIRPRAVDFKRAASNIDEGKPIDYDGASSPLDLTAEGEMYPDLVHWKIQGGQFVELERYRCDPSAPSCSVQR